MTPIYFREAVLAIGEATEATIRQWLNSGKVQIEGGYGNKQWATFTVLDIATLALCRKLVDFNFPIREAYRLARAAIQLGHREVQHKHFTRTVDLYAGWEGLVMSIKQNRNTKKWELARWKKSDQTFGNFVLIDVHEVVSEAMERLERIQAQQQATEPPDKKARSA